jgi:arylsulfatase A-like enzyme
MRVIYMDVDSLRPDHTEPHGYRRKITSNLKEFAREAVVFDRYYCSEPAGHRAYPPCAFDRSLARSDREPG